VPEQARCVLWRKIGRVAAISLSSYLPCRGAVVTCCGRTAYPRI